MKALWGASKIASKNSENDLIFEVFSNAFKSVEMSLKHTKDTTILKTLQRHYKH